VIIPSVFTGVIRSHFDFLKRTRDARIDRFVIESNKVLIRLDKVSSFMFCSKLFGSFGSLWKWYRMLYIQNLLKF